jgi:hypothetical protein
MNLEVVEFFKENYLLDVTDKVAVRNFIAATETAAHLKPQEEKVNFDDKVKHHFSKSVYARELHIPAGTLIIGKIHKHENFNILSQGEMLVLSVDGAKHVEAPFSTVSSAGVKRLAFAITDCVWTTIHGTDETDLEKIEEQFIAKTYNDVIEKKEILCLGGQ